MLASKSVFQLSVGKAIYIVPGAGYVGFYIS